MTISMIIIFCGIWNIYNYASMIYGLPYISFATSNFLVALNVMALKWSLILGIIYVVFGVLSLFYKKSEDDKLDRMKIGILVLAIFTSVCLLF